MQLRTFEMIQASLPQERPSDYTNGFTYLMNQAGYDAQGFWRETEYTTPTSIYNLVRGDTTVFDCRYKHLQSYAKILYFASVADLVDSIEYIERLWGREEKRIRGGKVDSIEQILDYLKSHDKLNEELCNALCYHARMKTQIRRVNNAFDYQAVMQEVCRKLNLADRMKEIGISQIRDCYGNIIASCN